MQTGTQINLIVTVILHLIKTITKLTVTNIQGHHLWGRLEGSMDPNDCEV